MYFLTFGSDDKEDREYGPRCAERAVQEMHGRTYPSAAKPLYVAEVIKKGLRDRQIEHESLKFKLSRKRCNLFVRNFPGHFKEEDIRATF